VTVVVGEEAEPEHEVTRTEVDGGSFDGDTAGVTVTDTAGFGDTKGWNGSIGRRMFEDQE
jgi:hypothetical protein